MAVTIPSALQTSFTKIPTNPYFTETILQWLQRPYPVASFQWTSTPTVGNTLLTIPFPRALESITPIWEKLNRFAYIRSKIKISIRVNGTKFHYGRLMAVWMPLRGASISAGSISLNSLSAYPHVQISPTSNEVVEMELPYVHPYQYLRIGSTATEYSLGILNVVVLTPLRQGTTTVPVEVTIFANFCDPELSGYTHEDVTKPTSGISRTLISNPVGNSIRVPPLLFFDSDRKPFLEAQADEGVVKSSTGLVSRSLESAARIVSLFPAFDLGVYSTFLKASSVVARHLGYCKPVDVSKDVKVLPVYQNLAHSHGLEPATVLALSQDAKVAPSFDFMGADKNTMDLLHYMSRPGLLTYAQWNTSAAAGSTVATFYVAPMNVHGSSAPTAGVYTLYNTPLSYGARTCNLWRGSIQYTVQVIASEFHAGRLRISWNPFGERVSDDVEASTLVNTVIDIRGTTQITFLVPYLKSRMWALTKMGADQYNGCINITIVNTLTHAQAATNPVNVNVWVAAGPDFQLSFPASLAEDTVVNPPPALEAQMFIGDSEVSPLIPAQATVDKGLCVSDEVQSIVDLIQRPNFGVSALTTVPSGTGLYKQMRVEVNPLMRYDLALGDNYLTHFQATFAVAKGGFVIRVVSDIPNADRIQIGNNIAAASVVPYDISPEQYLDPHDNFNSTGSVVYVEGTVPAMAVIPFYSNGVLIPMEFPNAYSALMYNFGRVNIWRRVADASVTASFAARFYLSAADDYQFGMQIGPPATVLKSNALVPDLLEAQMHIGEVTTLIPGVQGF